MDEYSFKTKVRNREVKYRKWKVKDKKKFTESIKTEDQRGVLESLVYDCIEDKNIAFTMNEYKYLLLKIRNETMGSNFDFSFVCPKCDSEYTINENISEILTPVYNDYDIIKTKNNSLKMGPVKNKQVFLDYTKDVESSKELYLIEFLFQLEKINDNEMFTFEEANEFIDELDYDEACELFEQWEKMNFKLNDMKEETCPKCGDVHKCRFDDLPELYPEIAIG
jgi:hypothetical protein